MLLKKRPKVKFLYKRLIKVRENIDDRTKLLKFKKKKWSEFIEHYSRKLRWYKRYKPYDQSKCFLSRYPTNGTAFKKRFRNTLTHIRKLRLFYGGLSGAKIKRYIKTLLFTKTKKTTHRNFLFLKILERRLDTILYRSKFARSFKNARQLINHKKVFVNNKIVDSPAYELKQGDLISFNLNIKNDIEKNIKSCLNRWVLYKVKLWPLPPKHLIINYNTMEIIVDNIDTVNLSTDFKSSLNLDKILKSYYKY